MTCERCKAKARMVGFSQCLECASRTQSEWLEKECDVETYDVSRRANTRTFQQDAITIDLYSSRGFVGRIQVHKDAPCATMGHAMRMLREHVQEVGAESLEVHPWKN